MRRAVSILSVLAWSLFVIQPAPAFDEVRLKSTTRPLVGTIVDVTPGSVTIEVNSVPNKVAVNEISWATFEQDPSDLKQGRLLCRGKEQDFEKALVRLEKVKPENVSARKESAQELAFYKALCRAKLALAGSGDVTAAGNELVAFLNANSTSYHYYEANELIGSLLVASGKQSAAVPFFDKLGTAPWPDYKLRANVLTAQAHLAQQKYAEALKLFEAVLATAETGNLVAQQKLTATLGKAICLAETGKADEGLAMIENVIDKADAEDALLHARAYNARGRCYLKQAKKKEALLAFLHVEVLYSENGPEHAEALFHLAKLWSDSNRTERANRALNTLKSQYPNSPWARQ